MMPPYPVLCLRCGKPAVFKIAARWSDGATGELKTYALCCADCLPAGFREARLKQAACRRAPGESLEPPGIYEWEHGRRDRQLVRRTDLEGQLAGAAS
jgi:hypothetical protein